MNFDICEITSATKIMTVSVIFLKFPCVFVFPLLPNMPLSLRQSLARFLSI